MRTCDPRIWDMEAGESRVLDKGLKINGLSSGEHKMFWHRTLVQAPAPSGQLTVSVSPAPGDQTLSSKGTACVWCQRYCRQAGKTPMHMKF